MKLYINLLNFNNYKLTGVGYFFKRIVSNIDFNDVIWDKFDKIVVLSNSKIDPIDLFSFNKSSKLKVVNFPFAHNFLVRIFFEQIILPFYFINSKGIFYSPTPSIPLLGNIFNSKVALIPTIHDMIPFKVKDKYSRLRSIYVKLLSKKAAQMSKCIITVSEFSKQDICNIVTIPLSKVSVVYNFIPQINFEQSTISQPYFVTVCTIEPGKNIENMIIGFHKFLQENKEFLHFKYIIIGQFGWNYDSVISLVSSLGIEENVEFTGYLNDLDKNDLLRCSLGMIYLSKYEGFGIPPLEAMYFNKISIVSNNSSLPEVVGDAGIIQDPNDTDLLAKNLKRLISNSEDYTINIAKQLVKFNPQVQIKKFIDIIISCSF